MPPFTTAAAAAAAAAAVANTSRARRSRTFALWVVTFAVLLGRQLLVHHRMFPDPMTPTEPVSFGAQPSEVVTIGVAVTVTGCHASFPLDGAIVLKHSFLRHPSERYRYQFYAIYHPEAAKCVPMLADAGYVLLERPTPVNVSAIRGEYLRRTIPTAGCCGDKELIKFEAFLLTEHPVVILMDMDMLVLKPLDDVVDLILHNNPHPEIAMRHLQNTSGSDGSNVATGDIWLLYVHDYFMTKPPYLVNPSQGGFAILKPNRSIYSEIQQIVLKGDFHDSLGWGNATGTFWGSMTFQGLLPYYFQVLHPGHALALDWCRHDYMHMPPTTFISSGNETVERCLAPNCQDCLDTAFEDVHTVHLTLCDKPWMCENYDWKSDRCKAMQRAWFQYRSELERSWGRSGRGSSNQTNEHLLGYCSKWGAGGYEAIRQPYGVPV